MDDTNTAALLGAATGAASIADSRQGRKAVERENQRSREFQSMMWDKTNEYNNPLNQRKRLEAAGMNPNLSYGNGSVANTATLGHAPETKPVPGANITGALSAGLESYVALTNQKRAADMFALDAAAKAQQIAESEWRMKFGDEVNRPATLGKLANANEITAMEIALKTKDLGLKDTKAAMDNLSLLKASELRQTSLDTAKEVLRGIQLTNTRKVIDNSTAGKRNEQAIQESQQRIQSARQSRDKDLFQRTIEEERLKLAKRGMTVQEINAALGVAKTVVSAAAGGK